MFCKKGVLLCHVSMIWTLVDLFCTKRLFSQETVFSPYYFTRDKNGFALQRISYSRAINKVKTRTFCRVLNYSTEHLKVPDNYGQLFSKHFLFSKTSSRRLEDFFSVTLFVFQDLLKTSLRCFQDVFKTCLQDVLQLCLQDVLEDKKMLH